MTKKWIYFDGGKTEDITGQKYNMMTFVKFVRKSKDTAVYWLCKCDCTEYKVCRSGNVKNGQIKSCGCLQKEIGGRSAIDMTNIDTGYWKIDFTVETKRTKNGHVKYWCHCTRCGKNSKWVSGACLRDGSSKSCGCLHRDRTIESNRELALDMTDVDTGYWEIDFNIKPKPLGSSKALYYLARCTLCNKTIRWVMGSRMKSGDSKSCGCLQHKYRVPNKTPSNFNPAACDIINEYGLNNDYNFRHAMNGGEVRILKYYVDGYDPTQNIVIEIDEPHHYRNGKLKKKDIKRQRRIMRYLGCTFIRIRVDNRGNILCDPEIYRPEDLPELYPNHGIIKM